MKFSGVDDISTYKMNASEFSASGIMIRGGDLCHFGVARATPTSKSTTPIHASATPTWEKAIFGLIVSAVNLQEQSFYLKVERLLKGTSVGLRGACIGFEELLSA